jgi:quercetin dioxygenase-like cupin family protein
MANTFVYTGAGTGEALWVMGDRFTYLVTGSASGGSYFTLLAVVSPNAGPPPHVHRAEDEQFYVLDGELVFSIGDETLPARAGDFVHIPRGTVHAFKSGLVPSRLLVTFSPAGIEDFFRAIGDPVTEYLASPPPVTEATIARLQAAEAAGWKDHHETLLP